MPKTLFEVNKDANPIFLQAPTKHPELAALVLEAMDFWSQADMGYTFLLSLCLNAEFKTVNAMLSALNSPLAQQAACVAGIKMALSETDFKVVQSAIGATTASNSQRNRFAHHIWGYAPEVPNALLLVNPKDYSAHFAEEIEMAKQGALNESRGIDKTKILVFTRDDLELERAAAGWAMWVFQTLGKLVTCPPGDPEAESIRAELSEYLKRSQESRSQSRQTARPKRPK